MEKLYLNFTVFVHASFDTFFETTRPALIAMRLVDLTAAVALVLAYVLSIAANGALEKASAPFRV